MRSHAHVPTASAARYMTQLAKHWSHKFEVVCDQRQASFPLPLGQCRMTANEGGLDVVVEAEDAEDLARLKTVVANHLLRFAFREPELAFDWHA
jgi:hypothetical protein